MLGVKVGFDVTPAVNMASAEDVWDDEEPEQLNKDTKIHLDHLFQVLVPPRLRRQHLFRMGSEQELLKDKNRKYRKALTMVEDRMA